MTDRELMQQALEALTQADGGLWLGHQRVIAALRERLAQPDQEPVAWNWMQEGEPCSPAYYGKPPDSDIEEVALRHGKTVRLLYTNPQPEQDAVLAEREACADIADQHASIEGIAQSIAAAIRARGHQ